MNIKIMMAPTMVVALGLIMFSCIHKVDINSLNAVSFANDIQPIIAGNCSMSGCHSDSQSSGHADGDVFSLANYNDVMQRGEIKSGDARGSNFYRVISNKEFAQRMPPEPRTLLSDDQIKLIYIWIEQGAKNN